MNHTKILRSIPIWALLILINNFETVQCSIAEETSTTTLLTREQQRKLQILQSRQKPSNKVGISAWAKKAGGTPRRNNLLIPVEPTSPPNDDISNSSQNNITSIEQPQLATSEEAEEKNVNHANLKEKIEDYNYDEDGSGSEEDGICKRGYYRNVRSRLCVPYNCSGVRNRETGECEHYAVGFRYYSRYLPRRYVYRRIYRGFGMGYGNKMYSNRW